MARRCVAQDPRNYRLSGKPTALAQAAERFGFVVKYTDPVSEAKAHYAVGAAPDDFRLLHDLGIGANKKLSSSDIRRINEVRGIDYGLNP